MVDKEQVAAEQEADYGANEILDDDVVIRKIPASDIKAIPGTDKFRVSKAAFSASSKDRDPEQGMSVDLWSAVLEIGLDPRSENYAPDFDVLMTLSVGELRREFSLVVKRRPREDNPAHCNVIGVRSSMRRRLLREARWLRRPANLVKFPEEAA